MSAAESEEIQVYSSFVEAVSYDRGAKALKVRYRRGGSTVYSGVPKETAALVLDASSVGKALHLHIQGLFPHRTIKPEAKG